MGSLGSGPMERSRDILAAVWRLTIRNVRVVITGFERIVIKTSKGKKMVGAVRFELTTSCTRNKRASQATLRPDPKEEVTCRVHVLIANENGLKPAAAVAFWL